jgi:hypothetical protein
MNGPEDGATVDVHSDGTFGVGSYDNDYLANQWEAGGPDGRGDTTRY